MIDATTYPWTLNGERNAIRHIERDEVDVRVFARKLEHFGVGSFESDKIVRLDSSRARLVHQIVSRTAPSTQRAILYQTHHCLHRIGVFELERDALDLPHWCLALSAGWLQSVLE